MDVGQKQAILETLDVAERLEKVYGHMQGELSVLQVEKKIKSRVKTQMEKTQREYYLNEQMKAIQKELGDGEDGPERSGRTGRADPQDPAVQGSAREGGCRAEEAQVDVADVSRGDGGAQLSRLAVRRAVGREVPRQEDLGAAQKVLDADHYGLEKVKERIVEYLAVQARSTKLKGPILCLVGPPGVGKTSLGRSVAKARAASSSASALAACGMNPRSAVTGGPISGRCRADHPVAEEGQDHQPADPSG